MSTISTLIGVSFISRGWASLPTWKVTVVNITLFPLTLLESETFCVNSQSVVRGDFTAGRVTGSPEYNVECEFFNSRYVNLKWITWRAKYPLGGTSFAFVFTKTRTMISSPETTGNLVQLTSTPTVLIFLVSGLTSVCSVCDR